MHGEGRTGLNWRSRRCKRRGLSYELHGDVISGSKGTS